MASIFLVLNQIYEAVRAGQQEIHLINPVNNETRNKLKKLKYKVSKDNQTISWKNIKYPS